MFQRIMVHHRTYKCLFILSCLAIVNLLVYIYLSKPSVLQKRDPKLLLDPEHPKFFPKQPTVARSQPDWNCSGLEPGELPCKDNSSSFDTGKRIVLPNPNSLNPKRANATTNNNNDKENNHNNGEPLARVVEESQPAAEKQAAVVMGPEERKQHVFPHDFQLVINHPDKCKEPVYLLVFVNTIHKNFDKRKAIRDTWASVKDVKGRRVVTLFTLAKQHEEGLQELVVKEDKQFGDLLMEDFHDSYKNLTYKSVMGFKWAANYCPSAKYVMKTDDDMFVHYENLVKFLETAPDTHFAAGYVINGAPIRDKRSKWYMPKELYPDSRYPPFMSGTGYVMSGEVAHAVYSQSLDTPFLYLEDVFVGICLKAIGVVPKKQADFHNWRTGYSLCRYRRIITSHMIPPMELYRIWRDMRAKKSIKC